jgi:Ca2+/Na+ antiporter
MLQPQYYYNLIQAVVYFIAATVPVYFILKLKNTNNDNDNDNGKRHLRNMTILLVSFILIQGVYHIAGTIGFRLFAKGLLEPLSIMVLLSFGILYLIGVLKERRLHELRA